MKELQWTVKSYDQQLNLSVYEILDENPKGIIQIVHGMAEHKYRYVSFMQTLAKNGYIVCIHDHRGHGGSIKQKEDLGYFYTDDVNALVKDTYEVTKALKKKHPNLPLYMIGHSMGSLVVREYCRTYDIELSGLVICGSPSKQNFALLGSYIVKCLRLLKGKRYQSQWIQQLAFGSFDKKFQDSTLENRWLARNQEVVKAFNRDSRCGFIFSLQAFHTLFSMLHRVYQPMKQQVQHPSLPILFIAGENDPCIQNQQKFLQAVNAMKKRGYQCVEAKLFPQGRHEILFDDGNEDVYQCILAWFNNHKL